MGWKNREIEQKLIVTRNGKPARMADVEKVVNKLLKSQRKWFVEEFSKDVFYRLPKTKKRRRGFARVRFQPDGTGQLTVKLQDKGTNVDRIEVDTDVTCPKQAVKFMRALLGRPPAGDILKYYFVHFLENRDTTVSVYKVHTDRRVFVEVESRTHKRMRSLERLVVNKLEEAGFHSERVSQSLFDLFFSKKGAKHG